MSRRIIGFTLCLCLFVTVFSCKEAEDSIDGSGDDGIAGDAGVATDTGTTDSGIEDQDGDTGTEIDTENYSDAPCTWRWVDVGYDFKAIPSIWGSASDDVYIVSYGGPVLHYNGSDWENLDTGLDLDYTKVFGTSKNNVILVGHQDAERKDGPCVTRVLQYNGQNWREICAEEIEKIPFNYECVYREFMRFTDRQVSYGEINIDEDGSCRIMDIGLLNQGQIGGAVWASSPQDFYAFGVSLNLEGFIDGWVEGIGVAHFTEGSWEFVPIEEGVFDVDTDDADGEYTEVSCDHLWGNSKDDVYVGCWSKRVSTTDYDEDWECNGGLGFFAAVFKRENGEFKLISPLKKTSCANKLRESGGRQRES